MANQSQDRPMGGPGQAKNSAAIDAVKTQQEADANRERKTAEDKADKATRPSEGGATAPAGDASQEGGTT
jgi:hypothetical protein